MKLRTILSFTVTYVLTYIIYYRYFYLCHYLFLWNTYCYTRYDFLRYHARFLCGHLPHFMPAATCTPAVTCGPRTYLRLWITDVTYYHAFLTLPHCSQTLPPSCIPPHFLFTCTFCLRFAVYLPVTICGFIVPPRYLPHRYCFSCTDFPATACVLHTAYAVGSACVRAFAFCVFCGCVCVYTHHTADVHCSTTMPPRTTVCVSFPACYCRSPCSYAHFCAYYYATPPPHYRCCLPSVLHSYPVRSSLVLAPPLEYTAFGLGLSFRLRWMDVTTVLLVYLLPLPTTCLRHISWLYTTLPTTYLPTFILYTHLLPFILSPPYFNTMVSLPFVPLYFLTHLPPPSYLFLHLCCLIFTLLPYHCAIGKKRKKDYPPRTHTMGFTGSFCQFWLAPPHAFRYALLPHTHCVFTRTPYIFLRTLPFSHHAVLLRVIPFMIALT